MGKMGGRKEEEGGGMKEYMGREVIGKYGEGFNKGVKGDDLEFYGKMDFEGEEKEGEDLEGDIMVRDKRKNKGK